MADQTGTFDRQPVRDLRSPGELLNDIARDIGEMVRAELRLARVEITGKARRAGRAGGLLGGAAVCALLAAACFVVACIAALAYAMPVWVAALIMAVILACIGGACYAGGRARLEKIDPVPERTVRAIKENAEWLNQRTS